MVKLIVGLNFSAKVSIFRELTKKKQVFFHPR